MRKIISVSGVNPKREVLGRMLSDYINRDNRYTPRNILYLADYLAREVISKQPENVEWSFFSEFSGYPISSRTGSLVFRQPSSDGVQDITTNCTVTINSEPENKDFLFKLNESTVFIKDQGLYCYTATTLHPPTITLRDEVRSNLARAVNRHAMRALILLRSILLTCISETTQCVRCILRVLPILGRLKIILTKSYYPDCQIFKPVTWVRMKLLYPESIQMILRTKLIKV